MLTTHDAGRVSPPAPSLDADVPPALPPIHDPLHANVVPLGSTGGAAGAVPYPLRPTLLYISPFVPMAQGLGSAMRAAANLQALCGLFTVTLAVVNPDPEEMKSIAPFAPAACAKILVVHHRSWLQRLLDLLPNWRAKLLLQMIWPGPAAAALTDGALRNLAEAVDLSQFDAIHCFRLHAAPVADLVPKGLRKTRLMLDLDDYESQARMRGLWARGSKSFVALSTFVAGLKYRIMEARYIPQFNTAYVCSSHDRDALARRFPMVRWEVVPNIVTAPAAAPRQPQDRFTFLFVGTLNYGPNKDAVVFFCREVLPLLRRAAPVPFKLRIVGRHPGEDVIALGKLEGVEVIANPPDVTPFYAQADVCIAPIRAGGGTRIKILEAFSYKLPVVATTIGAEGLGVVPSVHAEVEDTADGLAHACARLMVDASCRERLAEAGYQMYQERFSPEMLARLFREVHAEYAEPPAGVLLPQPS